MTIDEMRRTVEEADNVEFVYRKAEQRVWKRAQLAKAPEVLALLRRHMPAGHLQEVEEFLSNGFGSDCLRDELRRDDTRKALRKRVPAEHWQEIESYLETGVGTGRVGAALLALESEEGWRPMPIWG